MTGKIGVTDAGDLAPLLRSHLLAGQVAHRRLRGVDYQFTHRVWYLAVDLDEVAAVDARSRLLRYERPALLQLRTRDHLAADNSRPLGEEVRAHLAVQGIDAGQWRITLIAYPSVLGYVFNPVSFFFCHDDAGVLQHVIAEVHNTHGEREIYDFAPEVPGARVFTSSAIKRFYVSPFIGADAEYHLRVVETDRQIAITIHEDEAGRPVLAVAVRLRRVPLTEGHLVWSLLGDPLVPLKTISLIGWHAFRLWLQGQPWERFRPRDRYG